MRYRKSNRASQRDLGPSSSDERNIRHVFALVSLTLYRCEREDGAAGPECRSGDSAAELVVKAQCRQRRRHVLAHNDSIVVSTARCETDWDVICGGRLVAGLH
jgi:hypothetical protein